MPREPRHSKATPTWGKHSYKSHGPKVTYTTHTRTKTGSSKVTRHTQPKSARHRDELG